jgi:predicted ATPase
MTVLTLTPAERTLLAHVLERTISDYSQTLAHLTATRRGNTNVATLFQTWRSQAVDLRERLAGGSGV